jgi:predicted RNA binding protein YcfA (HicA-like mRNA interferase family)
VALENTKHLDESCSKSNLTTRFFQLSDYALVCQLLDTLGMNLAPRKGEHTYMRTHSHICVAFPIHLAEADFPRKPSNLLAAWTTHSHCCLLA